MARPAKMSRFGRFLRTNHPAVLEKAYDATTKTFERLEPVISKIGNERVEKALRKPEHWAKSAMFDCRMCGQCVLHSTGMTCPMTCPKNLRNGPCGGVRQDGNCEVFPDTKCVWVEAFDNAQKMPKYGQEFTEKVVAPLDRQLEGKSAFVTQMTGEATTTVRGWVKADAIEVVR